jgi:hypothetical protein
VSFKDLSFFSDLFGVVFPGGSNSSLRNLNFSMPTREPEKDAQTRQLQSMKIDKKNESKVQFFKRE